MKHEREMEKYPQVADRDKLLRFDPRHCDGDLASDFRHSLVLDAGHT